MREKQWKEESIQCCIGDLMKTYILSFVKCIETMRFRVKFKRLTSYQYGAFCVQYFVNDELKHKYED